MIEIIVCILTLIATWIAFVAYNSTGYLDPRGYILTWVSGLLAGIIMVIIALALSNYMIGG